MSLAVCLLLDDHGDRALRALWDRLEALGVPTLRSHTHGRHLPHLSYAVLRDWRVDDVRAAVCALPDAGPVRLRFDALGTFRRGRCWLAPAVGADLVRRQQRLVEAVTATGAVLHRHYSPGVWLPHLTLAPRVPLAALPVLASAVHEILPLQATAASSALVDSGTGQVVPLPHVP